MYKAASRIRLRQFSFHLQTIQTIGWQLPGSQRSDCQNITIKNQTIWQFFRNSRFYWESAIWETFAHIDQINSANGLSKDNAKIWANERNGNAFTFPNGRIYLNRRHNNKLAWKYTRQLVLLKKYCSRTQLYWHTSIMIEKNAKNILLVLQLYK